MEKRYLDALTNRDDKRYYETYHNPIKSALTSIECIKFWSATLSSSLVYLASCATL
jgi:hypothetical protein